MFCCVFVVDGLLGSEQFSELGQVLYCASEPLMSQIDNLVSEHQPEPLSAQVSIVLSLLN